MATNQTQHYALNQWVLSDDVRMEDFNADNQKVDAALAGLSKKIDDAVTQVKATIPHVQAGTYVGTGTAGPDHPNTLTFDFVPKLVIINGIVEGGEGTTASDHLDLIAIQGTTRTFAQHSGSSRVTMNLIWNNNSLSWYASKYYEQGNWKDAVYHYIAIG